MNAASRPMVARAVPPDPRPRAEDGRELISTRYVLQWAFGVEHASLDFDEVDAVAGGIGYPSIGSEYRVFQQLSLGHKQGEGVRVDTSPGRSRPHDDADLVASLLRNTVPWHMATLVADLARTGRVPDWDLGEPRLQPKSWARRNQRGQRGRTEVCNVVEYVHRGRKRMRKDLWTPCTWVPGPDEIARARRHYLDWWGALHAMRTALRSVDLRKFQVTDALPPMRPWQGEVKKNG
ncbi:MAG: hypothetical protein ACWA5A_09320 [Marinibacterium sp.]